MTDSFQGPCPASSPNFTQPKGEPLAEPFNLTWLLLLLARVFSVYPRFTPARGVTTDSAYLLVKITIHAVFRRRHSAVANYGIPHVSAGENKNTGMRKPASTGFIIPTRGRVIWLQSSYSTHVCYLATVTMVTRVMMMGRDNDNSHTYHNYIIIITGLATVLPLQYNSQPCGRLATGMSPKSDNPPS